MGEGERSKKRDVASHVKYHTEIMEYEKRPLYLAIEKSALSLNNGSFNRMVGPEGEFEVFIGQVRVVGNRYNGRLVFYFSLVV